MSAHITTVLITALRLWNAAQKKIRLPLMLCNSCGDRVLFSRDAIKPSLGARVQPSWPQTGEKSTPPPRQWMS